MRSALESDYTKLIRDSCIITDADTGKLVAVYLKLDKKPLQVLQALKQVRYIKDVRTEGLVTNSRIFGYRPRETIRKDFCSSTSLATESPNLHQIVCDFGKQLAKYYKKYCGEVYAVHKKIADENVLEEWKIKDTVFTSGIMNKNNPLKYHHDSGNFKDVYSNMLAFKNKIKGGYLSIPEYDFGLEISDCSLTMFDGQKILHGVTPITYLKKDSQRFSIVYYTLKKMWNCEPLGAELERIKRVKTNREVKRQKRMTGELEKDKL